MVGLRCQLDWRPRETNVQADDLTNHKFDQFDPSLRVEASWDSLKFPMIELLMGFAESFKKRKENMVHSASMPPTKFQKSQWG